MNNETKNELIVVNEGEAKKSKVTQALEWLKSMKVPKSVKVLILGLALFFVGISSVEAYQDYQERKPIEASEIKFSQDEVKKLVATELGEAEILGLRLEREDGNIVYEVVAKDKSSLVYEMEIDASNGLLLKNEIERHHKGRHGMKGRGHEDMRNKATEAPEMMPKEAQRELS